MKRARPLKIEGTDRVAPSKIFTPKLVREFEVNSEGRSSVLTKFRWFGVYTHNVPTFWTQYQKLALHGRHCLDQSIRAFLSSVPSTAYLAHLCGISYCATCRTAQLPTGCQWARRSLYRFTRKCRTRQTRHNNCTKRHSTTDTATATATSSRTPTRSPDGTTTAYRPGHSSPLQ